MIKNSCITSELPQSRYGTLAIIFLCLLSSCFVFFFFSQTQLMYFWGLFIEQRQRTTPDIQIHILLQVFSLTNSINISRPPSLYAGPSAPCWANTVEQGRQDPFHLLVRTLLYSFGTKKMIQWWNFFPYRPYKILR